MEDEDPGGKSPLTGRVWQFAQAEAGESLL